MAEMMESSDSEPELLESPRVVRRPGTKRRRIVDCQNIVTVPVYSGRVSRTLTLYQENPAALEREFQRQANCPDSEDGDSESERVQGHKRKRVSTQTRRPAPLSDSEDERDANLNHSNGLRDRSPSPPASPTTPTLQTRRAWSAIREADRNLRELEALDCSPVLSRVRCEADDVILVGVLPSLPNSPREITVKIRCRGHIYRVPMRMTDRLQKVVDYLSERLGVEASRLLLLLKDVEVLTSQTPESLNISVADILDCVVLSEHLARQHAAQDEICLRVRGVEKNSFQLITIGKAESLKRLMDDYRSRMGLQRCRITFHFDGSELLESSTPQENEMESDDVIDVRVCPH